MTIPGTTSGPELLIDLDRASADPLHRQLADGLRTAIRTGRLMPHTRMPSTRVLATDLGVSRRLVVDAYSQLVAEGFLLSRHGSGTRVATVDAATAPQQTEPTRRYDSRLPARLARSRQLSPHRVAARAASRPCRNRFGLLRIRRPARSARGARRHRRLSPAHPRRAGRCTAHRALLGSDAGGRAARARAAGQRAAARHGGPRLLVAPDGVAAQRYRAVCRAGRRGRPRRRRPGRQRRADRSDHARTSVTDRRGALGRTAHRARGMGTRRSPGDRGRLRRGVPLRPGARRRVAGHRTRPGDLHRLHEQDTCAGFAYRLDGVAPAPGRCDQAVEGSCRHREFGDGPDRVRQRC